MDGEIDPGTVAELLAGPDPPRVVDIRSREAFDRGHIPGSENIPFAALPDRVGDLSGADHVVTVCPHGKASVQAARLVASFEGTADATVESMAGGLEAWREDVEATLVADGDRADAGDAPF